MRISCALYPLCKGYGKSEMPGEIEKILKIITRVHKPNGKSHSGTSIPLDLRGLNANNQRPLVISASVWQHRTEDIPHSSMTMGTTIMERGIFGISDLLITYEGKNSEMFELI